MEQLLDFTIETIGPKLRRREVSPVDLCEAALARIDRLDTGLRSFITVMREDAREVARAAEREIADGRYRGPLHGVPVALKDVINTAGVRTTNGSAIFRDHVPAEDAAVVMLLRQAGA